MAIFNQFFSQQTTKSQINPDQFKQLAQTLDQQSLQQLVVKARKQGISDNDIEAGLNFILSLR